MSLPNGNHWCRYASDMDDIDGNCWCRRYRQWVCCVGEMEECEFMNEPSPRDWEDSNEEEYKKRKE